MKLVIADTGPLIHLYQAQALDLLPLLGEVVVTPQVVREWSNQISDLRPDWFLTDDTAARVFATSLHFETHGSLGVLLWACGQQLISEDRAIEIFDRLEQSTLWLSRRVRVETRQALKQLFQH